MRRAVVLVWAGLALAALALGPVTARAPRLIWNASASLPIGLYRLEPTRAAAAGELVAYRPAPEWSRAFAARGYLPDGVPLLKPVAATAPSVVCRWEQSVFIDGRKVADALEKDRAGRPLPRWRGCITLDPEAVFLLAPDVPDALDSRYFGPVDRKELLGRIVPVRVGEGRG
ncbi:S26 family signal peptidase [Brevundimonas sp. P7753]|jgi:conjugative transfer signal peptidase TraF|nr:S26 family signal peptidase [Brevundimonas sp. P7753]MBK1970867.1 S26 family signal peptidase [Brevundimonas diminuta]NWE53847.1 S26 family signal peptidase [Brevundimonas sp. P7753]